MITHRLLLLTGVLALVWLLGDIGIAAAAGPSPDLLQRRVRTVYYPRLHPGTQPPGTQALNMTLAELLTHGLRPGIWETATADQWYYTVPIDGDAGVRLHIALVTDPCCAHLYRHEVLLIGIQVGDQQLTEPEIWAFIVPVAMAVNARLHRPDQRAALQLVRSLVQQP